MREPNSPRYRYRRGLGFLIGPHLFLRADLPVLAVVLSAMPLNAAAPSDDMEITVIC